MRAPVGAFGRIHPIQDARSSAPDVRDKAASTPASPTTHTPAAFASTRDSYPSDVSWEREDSDVFVLKLPDGGSPGEVFPDIESAILAATEQVHRLPSSPELPAFAEPHRRSRDSA